MATFFNNFALKDLNTFSIDAICQCFVTFTSADEVIDIIKHCKDKNLKWIVIGGGANVIFDGNYDGCVIKAVGSDVAFEGELVVADAGVEWDNFVAFCVGSGYGGVENLSLIPGTVGAAPVQNIGAYGVEAKDTIEWVEYVNIETLKKEIITNSECEFDYRESVFKNRLKGKAIITKVAFRLSKNSAPKLEYGALKERVLAIGEINMKNIRQAVIEIRNEKLPDPITTPNAGSFFKNPVVSLEVAEKMKEKYQNMPTYVVEEGVKLAAGWLIEQAGWKGKRIGNVAVHDKQALVIVNAGGATGEEIVQFSQKIIDDVYNKFKIKLSREVNIIK